MFPLYLEVATNCLILRNFKGFVFLADVWFHRFTRHTPAATPRPSRGPLQVLVCSRHYTVKCLVVPAQMPGTACRTEFQHPDDRTARLVYHCNTCMASLLWIIVVCLVTCGDNAVKVASAGSAQPSSCSNHHFSGTFCTVFPNNVQREPFIAVSGSDVRIPYFRLQWFDITPTHA